MSSSPASIPATVVWWRGRLPLTLPRIHRIGWVDINGRPHGHVPIPSHHLRLDQASIEAALLTLLVPAHYETPPTLIPASALGDQARRNRTLSVEATLIVAGHHVVDADLCTVYGLDVVAGLSAQLLGSGPRAHIVVEQTLIPPVRVAALTAAQRALDDFATSTPSQLDAKGWTRHGEDRWQRLLVQR